MSSDLSTLLDEAARTRGTPPDPAELYRRGRYRRHVMRGVLLTSAALLVLAGGVGLQSLRGPGSLEPVVSEPASPPGASERSSPTARSSDRSTGAEPAATATARPSAVQSAGGSADDPPCADDADRRDVGPAASSGLDRYLLCGAGSIVDHVYRFDAPVQPTGDVAADARAVLESLFDVPSDLEDQGYLGLSRDVTTGRIGIRDVRFSTTDGTLVVDFDLPEHGVGNYSTSTGMAVWHQLVRANLLQFEEVTQVELRANGTCEYGGYFEGSGCVTFGPEQAPWSDG